MTSAQSVHRLCEAVLATPAQRSKLHPLHEKQVPGKTTVCQGRYSLPRQQGWRLASSQRRYTDQALCKIRLAATPPSNIAKSPTILLSQPIFPGLPIIEAEIPVNITIQRPMETLELHIGAFQQDAQFDDWWNGPTLDIPFFGGLPVPFSCIDLIPDADLAFISEANEALKHFLQLGKAERLAASPGILQNCKEFLSAVGIEEEEDQVLWDIQDPTEIWQYVEPSHVHITRHPSADHAIYIFIACECAWEREHGLQLVFRKGQELTRISQQDGHLSD